MYIKERDTNRQKDSQTEKDKRSQYHRRRRNIIMVKEEEEEDIDGTSVFS